MPETFYYQGKLNFVWDEDKNKGNIKKHGISFETATLVFNDTYRIDYYIRKAGIRMGNKCV